MSDKPIQHFEYGVFCLRETFGPGDKACNDPDPVPLTEEEYRRQLSLPNQTWRCPRCGAEAIWDDDSLTMIEAEEENEDGDIE